MKTFAVFQSESFDYGYGADGRAAMNDKGAGKDVAEHVMTMLAARGITCEPPSPSYADNIWGVYPRVDGRPYEVMISWAIPLDRNEDHWAVELDALASRAGCLGWLFSRRQPAPELGSIYNVVNEVLTQDEREGTIRNLTWLSEEEFWKRYAR